MPPASETANVVLVHDEFVDGSGWLRVYIALKSQGYRVTIVRNPTISLAGDVEVTRRAIAGLQGPVILVGHSYGGVVITEAGNEPRVGGNRLHRRVRPRHRRVGLVVDSESSTGSSCAPDSAPSGPFPVSRQVEVSGIGRRRCQRRSRRVHGRFSGTVRTRSTRRGHHAARVEDEAELYLVATDDRMIPPDAQRAMAKRARATVVETKGSHAVYVSQAQAVTSLIEQAVTASIAAVMIRHKSLNVRTIDRLLVDGWHYRRRMRRHSAGVKPTARVKTRVKWL